MGYLSSPHKRMWFFTKHRQSDMPGNAIRLYTADVDHLDKDTPVYVNKHICFQKIIHLSERELSGVVVYSSHYGEITVSEDTPILMSDNKFKLAKEIIEETKGDSVSIKISDFHQLRDSTAHAVFSYTGTKNCFRDFIIPGFHYAAINSYIVGDYHIEKELVKKYQPSINHDFSSTSNSIPRCSTINFGASTLHASAEAITDIINWGVPVSRSPI